MILDGGWRGKLSNRKKVQRRDSSTRCMKDDGRGVKPFLANTKLNRCSGLLPIRYQES